ncbi:hypothetical protein BDP81DRAFT_432486 [Colletotrichum phormii]|uniref:Secreted protein n=1 Tax=Colletotrichum phormii TaxID=359342 RepID=A0AAI9ZM96_9PEZI|nr:uncharacterized protein BDP81DRAFT_432486 [Colletotrichum phormii]KAK1634266.1 hypothetical protein BDP81DRAFT_432486 [Colletotrichum phormii]
MFPRAGSHHDLHCLLCVLLCDTTAKCSAILATTSKYVRQASRLTHKDVTSMKSLLIRCVHIFAHLQVLSSNLNTFPRVKYRSACEDRRTSQ